MLKPKSSTIKEIVWLLRCFSWPLVVIAFVTLITAAGHEMRMYAFDNWCNANIRYPFQDSGHVDWCDVWWWHPLRALSRLIPGIAGGLALYWLCGAYLRRSNTGYLFTAIALTIAPVLKLAYVFLEPFKDWFKKQCLFGLDPNLAHACAQQLGSYGDQRFYIPILLPLVFWLLYHRTKKATTPKEHR